jgi:hypothetical protein
MDSFKKLTVPPDFVEYKNSVIYAQYWTELGSVRILPQWYPIWPDVKHNAKLRAIICSCHQQVIALTKSNASDDTH